MIYFCHRSQSGQKTTFQVLHDTHSDPVPHAPYDGSCLRNVDYDIHRLFLESARANEDVEQLRYRLLKRNTSAWWLFKERHLQVEHFFRPSGYARESPGEIADAVVTRRDPAWQWLLGRVGWTRNTLRRIGRFFTRRRSSSHSWLKHKSTSKSTSKRTSKRTSKSTSKRTPPVHPTKSHQSQRRRSSAPKTHHATDANKLSRRKSQ